ncbi:MAG: PD40 domain-containing protein [Chlorobi bacterium]|nr:PD40 domain-containing protein [Chlorobiota bacterium]
MPMRLILFPLFFCVALLPAIAQEVPYGTANTAGDDYAAAFRYVEGGGTEFWFTTSDGFQQARSRRLVHVPISSSQAETLPFPLNVVNFDNAAVVMDGAPAFPVCETANGLFVSNRTVDGKYHDNDLYEMHANRDGAWSVRRVDELNSDAWDDTPALSSNGKTLYFASDRRFPGSQKTDLFTSRRQENGRWSTPVPLDGINTPEYSEQTPTIGDDGYLYYATNQTATGDYDIWRAQIDGATGTITGRPEPAPFAGVNKAGSDEGHPLFSPGGAQLLFSSNRSSAGGTKDFDIYGVAIPSSKGDRVYLSVQLRTRVAGEDKTDPIRTTVFITDRQTGERSSVESDGSGEATIPLGKTSGSATDRRFRELIVTAQSPRPGFITSTDTLSIDLLCGRRLAHTLYLWDTAALRSVGCVQDFRIKNVRFFVTGYWCPTTAKFAGLAPCASAIPGDQSCLALDHPAPESPCESNELYTYAVKYTAPQVVATRQPFSNCIALAELNDPKIREPRVREVDSAFVKLVDAMRSALEYDCVQRAVRDGKLVEVDVVGWTDPRPLDGSCRYTGPDIDLNSSFVKIDTAGSPYIEQGILRNQTRFRDSKSGGNQLLSQLRAYHTAVLLDKLWEEQVEDYRELKKVGLLRVTGVGRAVSQENVDMAQQRSVSVLVKVPLKPGEAIAATLPPPGRYRQLCDSPCK